MTFGGAPLLSVLLACLIPPALLGPNPWRLLPSFQPPRPRTNPFLARTVMGAKQPSDGLVLSPVSLHPPPVPQPSLATALAQDNRTVWCTILFLTTRHKSCLKI